MKVYEPAGAEVKVKVCSHSGILLLIDAKNISRPGRDRVKEVRPCCDPVRVIVMWLFASVTALGRPMSQPAPRRAAR